LPHRPVGSAQVAARTRHHPAVEWLRLDILANRRRLRSTYSLRSATTGHSWPSPTTTYRTLARISTPRRFNRPDACRDVREFGRHGRLDVANEVCEDVWRHDAGPVLLGRQRLRRVGISAIRHERSSGACLVVLTGCPHRFSFARRPVASAPDKSAPGRASGWDPLWHRQTIPTTLSSPACRRMPGPNSSAKPSRMCGRRESGSRLSVC